MNALQKKQFAIVYILCKPFLLLRSPLHDFTRLIMYIYAIFPDLFKTRSIVQYNRGGCRSFIFILYNLQTYLRRA